MKKGCALAIFFFLAVIGVIVAIVFGATKGVVKAGESFLAQVSEGKIAEAYASSSSTLQSQQDVESFEANVKKLGLVDYASVSWSNRSVNNGTGTLEGTITTKKGSSVPIFMEFVKEGDVWKVLSVKVPQAGVAANGGKPTIPPPDELKKLSEDSLLAFNDAVAAGDFAGFHQQISELWRKQITAEKMKDIFGAFVDQKIDISSMKGLEPAFDEAPGINEDGIMVLKGHYASKSPAVSFELKYVSENSAWKLFGINVRVK
jgi:hypothetical protein